VSNKITQALEHAAQKTGAAAGKRGAEALGDLYHDTERRLKKVATNHRENDAKHEAELEKILKRGEGEGGIPREPNTSSADGGSGNPELDRLRKPRRPSIRKSSQFSVFRDAKRAKNGEDFVCPNSGKTIPCERDTAGNAIRYNERGRRDPNGFTRPKPNPHSKSGQPQNFHFGHVQDSEYRRLTQVVEENPGKFSWKQVLDEYNDPKHYQVEDPSTNVGHGSESESPGYGHYGKMLDPNYGSGAGQTSPFG
jgi:hypothetical protein